MCILIHHPASTSFTNDRLQDFFRKNPDGFGAIVKRGDTVEVIKSVGTFQEIASLYHEQVSGHEAIIHFRMKTHGDVDIANCHPYEVIPGLWMAHNGILSTGNRADPKMSDTWHYIQDFLKPVLEANPDMIFNVGFQKMISSHIGSNNKFGFMNQDGKTIIINRSSGVDHEGVWYSNTYAWTPWLFGYGTKPVMHDYQPSNKYVSGVTPYQAPKQATIWDARYSSSATWREWDRMDKEMATQQAVKETKAKRKRTRKAKNSLPKISTDQFKRLIRHSYNAVQLGGFQGALDWIEKHPMQARLFIYEIYGSERHQFYNAESIETMVSKDVGEAADLICDIWEEMEPELCQLAGIQLEGVAQ